MQYTELDAGFLQDEVARIRDALVYATGVETKVVDDPAQLLEGRYWAIVLTNVTIEDRDPTTAILTAEMISLYHHEPQSPEERNAVFQAVYGVLIKAWAYLYAHKALLFDETQEPIPYLNPENVTVNVRAVNDPLPGMAIIHSLPHWISIDQARA